MRQQMPTRRWFRGSRIRSARLYCGVRTKDGLKCIGALILPLVLGIFTVVITFDQRNEARIQRLEDRDQAREQRDQDMNISAIQRDLDKWIAQQQREHDKEIAETKRTADDLNAERQRNMSKEQREHEINIQIEQRRDNIFVEFITDFNVALAKNNGSLVDDYFTAAVMRSKALILIRQLDPRRNSQLIEFLYEAGQLTNGQSPLDLSNAELNDIDLSSTVLHVKMHGLYLAGTHLNRSSFANRDLTRANFTRCILNGTDFSNTILSKSDMSKTSFDSESRFIWSDLELANFARARFSQVDLSQVKNIRKVNFSETIILQSRLSGCDLYMTTFTHSYLESVDFSNISSYMIDFRQSRGNRINFTGSNLTSSKFDYADLFNSIFVDVHVRSAQFTSAKLDNARFIRCQCNNADFDNARLINADFSYAIISLTTWNGSNLDGASFYSILSTWSKFERVNMARVNFSDAHVTFLVDFVFAKLDGASFQRSQLRNVKFDYSVLTNVSFESTNLTNSRFNYNNLAFANFSNAILTGVVFIMNNLSYANLQNLPINDKELTDSLSIHNAILPDGTLGPPNQFLLRNGHADCNVSLFDSWKTDYGVVTTEPSDENKTNCYFVLSNNSWIAAISQRVNISRYAVIVKDGRALVTIHARLSLTEIVVQARSMATNNILQSKTSSPIKDILYMKFLLHPNTTELNVILQFGRKSTTKTWCDYIDLELDLDSS